MHTQGTRASAGKHRKQTASATSRIALVAAATGAVSTAGAAGAATAAHAQSGSEQAQVADGIELTAQEAPVIGSSETPVGAPQILSIAEFKPVENLADQLAKAIQFNAERIAADLAARAPQVAKPAEGVLTSGFGARWGALHAGVDIANALGTPIVAAEQGTVIDAGPASGFGQWVRILHDDGTITVYGHMETIDVTVGQQVTAGQRIAGMGSRGFSTGSHLHFEVHPAGSGPIDPLPWLAERGIHL